jgi:hypothetical protein
VLKSSKTYYLLFISPLLLIENFLKVSLLYYMGGPIYTVGTKITISKISFLSTNITKIIFTVPKQGFVRFFVKYNKGIEKMFIFYVSCNFPLNSTSLDTNIV